MQNKTNNPQPKPLIKKELMDWIKATDPKSTQIIHFCERMLLFKPEMDRIHKQVHGWDEQLKQKALSVPFSEAELRIMGFK